MIIVDYYRCPHCNGTNNTLEKLDNVTQTITYWCHDCFKFWKQVYSVIGVLKNDELSQPEPSEDC